VSNWISRGKIQLLRDGTIDADSDECRALLAKKSKRATKPAPPRKAKRSKPKPPPMSVDDNNDISGATGKLSLERRKLAAQAQQLELKNAQIEGRLVSREVMVRCVWNPLETFLVRLLTDGAKTITNTAYALIRSGLDAEARGEKGVPREEVEVAVRNELSSLVKPLKRDIKKAIHTKDV
jgi:hypothetical protein